MGGKSIDRTHEITRLLLNANQPTTIKEISKRFGISSEATRKNLIKLENILEGSGLILKKKTGVGTWIIGSNDQKQEFFKSIDEENAPVEVQSTLHRENYILKKLLVTNDKLTIKEISELFFVSKGIVYKDLKEVEAWLGKFNIILEKKRKYGLKVIGDERNLRNAIAYLILSIKENDKNDGKYCKGYEGRIDNRLLPQLKELIDLDYKVLEELVFKSECKFNYEFSNQTFTCLITNIAIAIKRLSDGKHVKLSKNILEKLKKRKDYYIVKELVGDIKSAFDIYLSESDIGLILLNIIETKGSRQQNDLLNLNIYESQCDKVEVILANEIIKSCEKTLTVDLRKDTQLLDGLVLHLRLAVKRLKHGLPFKNPLLDEIKEKYPKVFGATWIASLTFERYLGQKAPEDEIGYISLHIGAALERCRKYVKTIIVCHSGIGTSKLLLAKIRNSFSYIQVKKVLSSKALKEYELRDIDCIISTIPVDIDENIPVFVVTPFLRSEDIKKLNKFIDSVNNI